MKNFLKRKRFSQPSQEKVSLKSDCRKCWIIFPKSQRDLCNLLIGYIHVNFKIACDYILYESLDKSKTLKINEAFQEACVLIMGYEGELSYELCYKLGLAHGCRKQLILVRLYSPSESKNQRIPDFIRANFFLSCELRGEVEINVFVDEMLDILTHVLSGDLSILLYKKALKFCSSLENDSGCSIGIISKSSFLGLLINETHAKPYGNLTAASYLYDHEELYWQLILLIAKEPTSVLRAFSSLKEKIKKDPDSISTDGWQIVNLVINQFGQGDNIAGNKIIGNRNTSGENNV
jgi:hypothetical protein